ncbi:MAG TPA: hypothetical protein ENI23_06785 [bacterium]|nr:hypothetical protein [bacterium]
MWPQKRGYKMAIDDKTERATKWLKLRVTPSQYDRIKEYAGKQKKGVSDLIRELLLNVIAADASKKAPPKRKPRDKTPPPQRPVIEKKKEIVITPQKIRTTKPRPKGIYSYFPDLPIRDREILVAKVRKYAQKYHLDLETELEKREILLKKQKDQKKKE